MILVSVVCRPAGHKNVKYQYKIGGATENCKTISGSSLDLDLLNFTKEAAEISHVTVSLIGWQEVQLF